ncbi:NADPH oxidase B [Mrakia frigida]|uniref:NADPH oxidase B n=1 Tax=Mrakia frigida TaxID=29902 RepID=UPI003FCC24B6
MPPRNSGLHFSSGPPPPQLNPNNLNRSVSNSSQDRLVLNPGGPAHLTRNKTERVRIGGLAQVMKERAQGGFKSKDEKAGRVAGVKTVGKDSMKTRLAKWMVNEGNRRVTYVVWTLLHVLVAGLGAVHYGMNDNLVGARATFGSTFTIARSAALVLHVDAIFILFPVCRNFISMLRRTPLNDVIPFDKNITFHKQVAWSIVLWSTVHTVAHMVNFAKLAIATNTGVVGFLLANFATGPGVTGWIMSVALGIMVWFAMEKRRKAPGKFERFWYTHHLFIVFFACWQLHGMFCMIKPDRPPYCSFMTIGVFWKFWLPGGALFIFERILREVRGRHRTYVSKVILHPSNVCEVQIKKEHTHARAGQYIFINCPEVSYFQYHPFTLTSAPEEDYISVHIRVAGDWTTAFAKALGCNIPDKAPRGEKKPEGGDKKAIGDKKEVAKVVTPPLNRTLPRVMVDGPFGSASEDFTKFETILLVGAGIGVTPFASILKSIWYRLNNFGTEKKTRLSKVYFTWVIRDFGTAEWFHSLLHAIEEQDTERRIEITIYLTAKIKDDDMNNILVQDVGAERDAITSLRSPTNFGRPNWDRTFQGIVDQHPDTDCGVFFCGPPVLSKQLHVMSNKYTTPGGTRFFFGKENF